MIKDFLAKIGGPVWRLVQTSKHHHIGAIIVILVVGAVLWAVVQLVSDEVNEDGITFKN